MDNPERIRELLQQVREAEDSLAGLRAELATLLADELRKVVDSNNLQEDVR